MQKNVLFINFTNEIVFAGMKFYWFLAHWPNKEGGFAV